MSSILVIFVVVACALVAGLVANRYVRPFAKTEVQGIKLETLTGPIVSVTVLLIAFTLVTVYQSYLRGWTAAADEARKVDHQFEIVALLNEPERQRGMSATACYAAAVANYEWPTMEEGRTAPEVSVWTKELSATIATAVDEDQTASPVLSALLISDRDRGEARSRRLTEALPAVPVELKALLVLTSAFGVLVLATFTLGSVNRREQIGVLGTVALLFALFLATIWDMEKPYDGLIATPPSDMNRVAGSLTDDFAAAYPGVALPCDETGRLLQ